MKSMDERTDGEHKMTISMTLLLFCVQGFHRRFFQLKSPLLNMIASQCSNPKFHFHFDPKCFLVSSIMWVHIV